MPIVLFYLVDTLFSADVVSRFTIAKREDTGTESKLFFSNY